MSEKRKKKKKKRKIKYKGLDLSLVQQKLASLQQGNRLREAIIYAYYNYLDVVQGFFSIARRPSQTAREFAMDCVKNIKLPPAMLYPFTTLFEEARFGRHEINPNQYTEAFKLFQELYQRIMGGPKVVGPEPAPNA